MLIGLRASVTGATHRARGAGNQDAVGIRPMPGGGAMAALADGHSDPRCVRARRGADLAVEAALAAGAGPTVGAEVVARWRSLVDDERRAETGPPLPRLAYGTTLLACRWDPQGVTLVQIGDGDIVVVDQDGTASRPLQPRRPPTGTASLADEDVLLVEQAVPRPPRAVLLSSDGVDNAYPSGDALLEAAEDIARRFEATAAPALQRDVHDWVRRAAATSGDDASAVVLVLTETGRS
jgi:serine/threonine protein phosphatase PrpC